MLNSLISALLVAVIYMASATALPGWCPDDQPFPEYHNTLASWDFDDDGKSVAIPTAPIRLSVVVSTVVPDMRGNSLLLLDSYSQNAIRAPPA